MKKYKRQMLIRLVIAWVFVTIGVGIYVYPTVSSIWNSYVASKLVTEYVEKNDYHAVTFDFEKETAGAVIYNQAIKKGTSLVTTENGTKKDEGYEKLLNSDGNGIMGIIEIPKISQRLPIFHYSHEYQLANGVGHMYGSSLPIGGEGNCMLTGHRGVPNKQLFTRLDELAIGDVFYITVYGKVLAYKIVETDVVLPEEVSDFTVQEGRDLVTLVTCTPMGINSHRLILTAERTEFKEEEYVPVTTKKVVSESVKRDKLYIGLGVYGLFNLILVIRLITLFKKKPKKAVKAVVSETNVEK